MSAPGAVQVREAADAERAAMLALTFAAYADYGTAIGPAAWAVYRGSMAARILDDPTVTRLVAVADGTVVGAVLLQPPGPDSPPGPEVGLLGVDPAWRGRGIGAALMDACIARARAAGAGALYLHTEPRMPAAVTLYQRLGFTRAPAYDYSPVAGVDLEAYCLPLAPSG